MGHRPSRTTTGDRILTTVRVPGPATPELIVFASTDEIGCAQIAAAWFPTFADPSKARAVLASPHAALRIESRVAVAMREMGRDLKLVHTRVLSPELLAAADLVVTTGRTFERGFLRTDPPIRREHWVLPDPIDADGLDRARNLSDLIRSRVAMLVFMEGWGRTNISREVARVTRPHSTRDVFASA
jgi:protein-tyrosine-phosphatase